MPTSTGQQQQSTFTIRIKVTRRETLLQDLLLKGYTLTHFVFLHTQTLNLEFSISLLYNTQDELTLQLSQTLYILFVTLPLISNMEVQIHFSCTLMPLYRHSSSCISPCARTMHGSKVKLLPCFMLYVGMLTNAYFHQHSTIAAPP